MGFEIVDSRLNRYTDTQGVTRVLIPDNVTEIESYSFFHCTNIEEIVIPDTVTRIHNNAFLLCSSLKDIRLPRDLRTIGHNAFNGCESLKKVTIPDSIEQIGPHAFDHCEEIWYKGVKIPKIDLPEADVRYIVPRVNNIRFSSKLKTSDNYIVLWSIFLAYPNNPQVIKAVRRRLAYMLEFAIWNDRIDVVKAVCESNQILDRKNIDRYIRFTIDNGKHEAYIMLVNYKATRIGFHHKKILL